jgi:hypothetical protein
MNTHLNTCSNTHVKTNSTAMKTIAFTVMCVLYILTLSQVSANTLTEGQGLSHQEKAQSLESIQQQWQQALKSDADQETRFYHLQTVARKMFKLSLQDPNDAQLKAWTGIMLGSFAGASIEGRGAHVAIFAKSILEKAQEKQADVLNSSFLQNGMSARSALPLALAYNPSGVDINKYYGAFLTEGSFPDTGGLIALNKALKTDKSTQGVTQAIN